MTQAALTWSGEAQRDHISQRPLVHADYTDLVAQCCWDYSLEVIQLQITDNMNDSMCQQSLMGPHGVFEYMGVCMGRRPKLICSRDQNL